VARQCADPTIAAGAWYRSKRRVQSNGSTYNVQCSKQNFLGALVTKLKQLARARASTRPVYRKYTGGVIDNNGRGQLNHSTATVIHTCSRLPKFRERTYTPLINKP